MRLLLLLLLGPRKGLGLALIENEAFERGSCRNCRPRSFVICTVFEILTCRGRCNGRDRTHGGDEKVIKYSGLRPFGDLY
jgi:hypothetical protein